MKILSIGNSFSQDAHRWLSGLAGANGIDLETVNLYIGGCSLETHWQNFLENNAHYDFEPNGGYGERKISIAEALELEKWDVITVQQVSYLSGIYESYEPYLSLLVAAVRQSLPDAKIYFHQTWSYETDADHCNFSNYNNDQTEMYRCIVKASKMAAESINAEMIPTGRVIQHLREEIPEFDYKNGGMSLCRDGFHLSLDYGRFAAAATWLHTITGKQIEVSDFENFNPEILKKIIRVVNRI